MLDLVLPQCLSDEEVFCATEIASELGLKTQQVCVYINSYDIATPWVKVE